MKKIYVFLVTLILVLGLSVQAHATLILRGTDSLGNRLIYDNDLDITGSEMGNLYYTELGNLGYCDTAGNCPQPSFGLTNTGPFTNLEASYYWSGTEYAPNVFSWVFNFYDGGQ